MGASFIFWLIPGDTAPTVDLTVGTSPFNSNVANFTSLNAENTISLGSNQYGFNLEEDSYSFARKPGNPGTTYWITLQNASVPDGDPVYWDELWALDGAGQHPWDDSFRVVLDSRRLRRWNEQP